MSGRGPLPLEQAREILRGAQAFVRGDTREVEGEGFMTTADLMWQALLSLEDAAELCEVASRLDWQFHPRGFDNVELYERYGEGILPWLATRVDADGVLHNQPWCVVPCLLRCRSAEAFALAWRVRGIAGRTAWGGAGDGDLFTVWRTRHPDVAAAELARLAPHDARARAHLAALSLSADPPSLPSPASADDVLAHLDACFGGLVPTRVRLAPPAGARDLRVVAARGEGAWGLAFEWIEGDRPSGLYAARVAGLAFSPSVHGPALGVALSSRPVADLAAEEPDARLGPPSLALPALALPEPVTVIAAVPLATIAVPSESRALRRLAEAIAAPSSSR